MNGFRGFVVAAGLATAYVSAYPTLVMAAADDSKMSDADKLAKAQDCSKQADAKKLHGEARKKFRAACKKGM